jgi:tripartite-type tricarboxylate transporter receptor subunit TctC
MNNTAKRFGAMFVASLVAAGATAQETPFWAGKQISIVVASTAGGGYDTYARMLSRHMGRHVPGSPGFSVINMSGAGGNLAARHLSNTLPNDGTAMALVLPGTITGGLFTVSDKLGYDPSKLIFLGSANAEVDACWVRSDAGVKTLRDAQTKEVVMGASAEGGATREQPAALNALVGTKFKIVSGYPGTRQILMAVEAGEVSGLCAMSLSAMQVQHRDWLESGLLRPLSQNNPHGDETLTAQGVEKAVDLARTAGDRAAMDVLWSQQSFGRPFVLAPGVPDARVQVLRKAFWETLHDPALVEEAKNLRLDINPISGEDIQALVARLYASSPDVVRRATEALAGRRVD